ncbi:hypothetical protein SKP52_10935 [Sphingopyxis fribergensis]|uniref:ECF subfamily RNA polymerase sigma-24 factor n=2 Tax=Sphingopyxis fribergensis TaxID=1515612 RepID=A0A0A7PIP4_9SPHN|nr:hypothetical protein SKP52_10935 [Sphingopyxis fribergensis]
MGEVVLWIFFRLTEVKASEFVAPCIFVYDDDLLRKEGRRLAQSRSDIIAWVASNVIPHEGSLRSRLQWMAVSAEEIDDIVQDAYLAIAQLESIAHIRDGRAYLFTTARMVVLQRIRRNRIVAIDSLTEAETLAIEDNDPGPERRAGARRELERVRKLIEDLPATCREIFELRRVQGVPQRQIAERLGIAEHTVEQQAMRGLKLILKAIADDCSEQRTSIRKVDDEIRDHHGRG